MLANTPVVLSYFSQSNDPEDPYLEFLQDEYDLIAGSWERFQQTGSEKDINVLFPPRGSADAGKIDDDIRAYRHRIVVFHFSGHAGSGQLIFSDGSARAKGLAGLLGEAPNLKIVFLNGCATQDQVKLLFDKNIKAVIATKGKVNDGVAKEFSSNFYAAVSTTDYSIREAFEHAVNTLIKDGRIPDDSPTTAAAWRGIADEFEEERDRWELYVKEDFTKELDNKNWWQIGIINPTRKEVLTSGAVWGHRQVVLFTALFIVGLLIIVYGVFMERDFMAAAVGLASVFLSIFGFKNQEGHSTMEFNPEILDNSILKKMKLF